MIRNWLTYAHTLAQTCSHIKNTQNILVYTHTQVNTQTYAYLFTHIHECAYPHNHTTMCSHTETDPLIYLFTWTLAYQRYKRDFCKLTMLFSFSQQAGTH